MVESAAPFRLRAGAIHVIIGIAFEQRDRERACLFQKRQRVRPAIDKSLERFVHQIAVIKAAKVCERIFAAVCHAYGLLARIVRNPNDAARDGRCAAHALKPLDQSNRSAGLMRGQRGCHARRSAAQNDDIDLFHGRADSPA